MRAGVAVPVPDPAEIACVLDDADVADADFLEPHRGQQPADAAAEDHGIGLDLNRRARHDGFGEGIVFETRVGVRHFDELLVAVGAQADGPLMGVFATKLGRIETENLRVEGIARDISRRTNRHSFHFPRKRKPSSDIYRGDFVLMNWRSAISWLHQRCAGKLQAQCQGIAHDLIMKSEVKLYPLAGLQNRDFLVREQAGAG